MPLNFDFFGFGFERTYFQQHFNGEMYHFVGNDVPFRKTYELDFFVLNAPLFSNIATVYSCTFLFSQRRTLSKNNFLFPLAM